MYARLHNSLDSTIIVNFDYSFKNRRRKETVCELVKILGVRIFVSHFIYLGKRMCRIVFF